MIDAQNILDKVASDWEMSGLSNGLYADYACEVSRAIIHSLVTTLTKELGSGHISIEAIEFRANQLIKYPDS